MDKKQKTELFKKLIKKLYKKIEFSFIHFEILERQQYINGDWIPDTPSVFIELYVKNFEDREKISEVILSGYFNCEFNIKFV